VGVVVHTLEANVARQGSPSAADLLVQTLDAHRAARIERTALCKVGKVLSEQDEDVRKAFEEALIDYETFPNHVLRNIFMKAFGEDVGGNIFRTHRNHTCRCSLR
jgi:hypothetical protein